MANPCSASKAPTPFPCTVLTASSAQKHQGKSGSHLLLWQWCQFQANCDAAGERKKFYCKPLCNYYCFQNSVWLASCWRSKPEAPRIVKVCMWQGSRQAQFAPSNWLLQEVPCCSYCRLPYSFRAQSLRDTEWLLPQGIHLSSYNGLSPNHWWSCRSFSLTFVLKWRMKTHNPQPYPVHNET